MAPSSLLLALFAYLAILYEHLSGRTLADAAEGHCLNNSVGLPPPSEDLPEQVAATFRRLDILLRRVFRVISHFRRVYRVIDVVLHNDVARLQEAHRHLDCLIEAAGDRVDHAETPQAREERLWAQFFLIQQSEDLRETLERARQRVDTFRASFDHEPSDAAAAYEVLKTEIYSSLATSATKKTLFI